MRSHCSCASFSNKVNMSKLKNLFFKFVIHIAGLTNIESCFWEILRQKARQKDKILQQMEQKRERESWARSVFFRELGE